MMNPLELLARVGRGEPGALAALLGPLGVEPGYAQQLEQPLLEDQVILDSEAHEADAVRPAHLPVDAALVTDAFAGVVVLARAATIEVGRLVSPRAFGEAPTWSPPMLQALVDTANRIRAELEVVTPGTLE